MLHQPYAGLGLRPIGINTGPDLTGAKDIFLESGMTFPMLLDVDESLLAEYKRVGEDVVPFPLGYLVDRTGTLRAIYAGSEPSMAELEDQIVQLLGE